MERDVIEIVGIDSLVPKEHLLRQIDDAVDFNKLYEIVEELYCEDNGRPSIDPVVLFKMVLIQHLYGLPSLRRTAEEVSLNVAYRWFLGYSLQEETESFPEVKTIVADAAYKTPHICKKVFEDKRILSTAWKWQESYNLLHFLLIFYHNIRSPAYS